MAGKRVLVCGTRTWVDYDLVAETLRRIDNRVDSGFLRIDTIINGGAEGADLLATRWANENDKTVKAYLPDWNQYAKSAGPRRNQEMINKGKPDLVVAFWDGISRGTGDMITRAIQNRIPVEIVMHTFKQAFLLHYNLGESGKP